MSFYNDIMKDLQVINFGENGLRKRNYTIKSIDRM